MAYSGSKLNNIAGSMGLSNLWIYSDDANTLSTIDADNYFASSTDHGVRLNDTIILVGSDGCAFGWIGTLTSTTSVITTVTAIA